MATLQKLREKGPLLAIIIAVALAAFILGDLVRSGDMLFSKGQFEIGEVAGQTINVQEYQAKVEEVSEIYKMQSGSVTEETMEQIRRNMWEQLIRERILSEEYSELGIGVSSEELFDLVQGNNIDPTVKQLFTDPKTKQFNRAAVVQFINNLNRGNQAQKDYWLFIEKEVKRNREYQKYINMVSKGLFVSSLEAEQEVNAKAKKSDIKYFVDRYTSIPDSTVSISDSEISAVYEKNIEDYKQTEARDIEYITFNVAPSAADREDTKRWIDNMRSDFAATNDEEQFLRLNDPEHPFDRKHYKKDQLSVSLAQEMFEVQPGHVYGPYLENNAYKLAKLVNMVEMPDTIKARHILIRPTAQTREAYDLARLQIDSLKNLVLGGADFAELAKKHGQDGSAQKGGDLGWVKEGQMVRQFNDSCFASKAGDVKVVETQFGVHLLEVEELGELTTKVQIAVLSKEIEPSKETIDGVYAKANKFVSINKDGKMFDKGAADQGLTKKIASNLTPMAQNIAGLGKARQLIRAVNKAELGEVVKDEQGSPIFDFENKFVVAKLSKIREEGYQPLKEAKQMIRLQLVKEKKAEMIKSKIASKISSGKSIEAIASELGLEVKESKGVSFNSPQIVGAGYEPKVVSAASSLAENKVSNPIDGNMGVYVITVTSVNQENTTNVQKERKALAQTVRSGANFQVYGALKEATEIVDNRAKFY